MGLVVTSSVKV